MTTTTATTTQKLPAGLAAGPWDVDPSHSNVEFVVRHLLSKVRGRFTDFSGEIHLAAAPEDSSVTVSIDAASIDTHNADRDAHLRGADFLNAEQYPALSFRSTAMRPVGDRYEVDGELTIRDVTRPVTLELEYLGASPDPWGGTRAGFSARTEIDRDDFGASWNVVLETGGLLVGRQVKIELEIEAVQRKG